MRCSKYFLLLFLCWTMNLYSQNVEIYGYFEPQLMGAQLDGKFYQLSSNKLRVDLSYDASDRVSFGANFDYITYHGKTKWAIRDYLPQKIQATLPDFEMLGYSFDPYQLVFDNRQFLDNAYLKLSFKYADVMIGKQQISMGTGYVWNPTDVFNLKDVTDPTYEQPGHNALRIDVPLGNNYTFTSIYSPGDDWDYNDVLVKLKGYLMHFDISVLGIVKQWKYTDARLFDPLLMQFHQINTKRRIVGADFAGELLGLGVWGEYTYTDVFVKQAELNSYHDLFNMSQSSFSSDQTMIKFPEYYHQFVLGTDYTFDSQTYVMSEYYHNGRAKSDKDRYTFNDWMQMLFGETKSICKDQLYCMIQHPVTDLINAGCSSIVCLNDNSVAIVPMITYNIFQNVDLTLIGNYCTGTEGTTYAKNLGNGGLVRARVYF